MSPGGGQQRIPRRPTSPAIAHRTSGLGGWVPPIGARAHARAGDDLPPGKARGRSARVAPRAGSQRHRVVKTMQHYRCGFNADEVSRAVGFDCHQRMSDLHRDGYLRDTGVTRAPEEVAAAAVFWPLTNHPILPASRFPRMAAFSSIEGQIHARPFVIRRRLGRIPGRFRRPKSFARVQPPAAADAPGRSVHRKVSHERAADLRSAREAYSPAMRRDSA